MKDKQIEEMARELYNDLSSIMSEEYEKRMLITPSYCANKLLEKGYLKVLEDSVVLSREEYSELKGRAEEVFNEMTERMKAEVKIAKKMGIVKGSKETAEKILKWLVETGVINTAPDTTKMYFKEEFGVEVEE